MSCAKLRLHRRWVSICWRYQWQVSQLITLWWRLQSASLSDRAHRGTHPPSSFIPYDSVWFCLIEHSLHYLCSSTQLDHRPSVTQYDPVSFCSSGRKLDLKLDWKVDLTFQLSKDYISNNNRVVLPKMLRCWFRSWFRAQLCDILTGWTIAIGWTLNRWVSKAGKHWVLFYLPVPTGVRMSHDWGGGNIIMACLQHHGFSLPTCQLHQS
jgi:hypothetical protein